MPYIVEHRPGDGDVIQTGMSVKSVILHGNHRVHIGGRKFVERGVGVSVSYLLHQLVKRLRLNGVPVHDVAFMGHSPASRQTKGHRYAAYIFNKS